MDPRDLAWLSETFGVDSQAVTRRLEWNIAAGGCYQGRREGRQKGRQVFGQKILNHVEHCSQSKKKKNNLPRADEVLTLRPKVELFAVAPVAD